MRQRLSRPAVLLIAAIILLGIGWLVLALYLKPAGTLSAPGEPTVPTSPEESPAPDLTRTVLASKTETHPKFTREITYRYDAHGRLVQENWNDGTVTIDYLYHENGNPMSKIKCNESSILYTIDYRPDGTKYQEVENTYYTDGRLSSTETTQYDERGNLLSRNDVDADGDSGATILFTNEYDADGRLILQETRRADGTLLHVDTWDYHDSGCILDSTEYNGDPDDNPVWRHEIHTYDAGGKLLSIQWDMMDMSPSRDFQTFRYDEYGNPVRDEWVMYPVNNEDFVRYVTEYDNTYENGLLVRTEVFYSETSSWDGETTETPRTLSRTEIRKYDEAGNLIFHDDGTSTYTYTYLPLEQVLFS